MVEEITDQNFAEETDNGVVLTDFWATWYHTKKTAKLKS